MTHARIRAGAVLDPRELGTITGSIAPVPDPDRLVHLLLGLAAAHHGAR